MQQEPTGHAVNLPGIFHPTALNLSHWEIWSTNRREYIATTLISETIIGDGQICGEEA
jgi:hypothetical protein